jgi:hypothetical protein
MNSILGSHDCLQNRGTALILFRDPDRMRRTLFVLSGGRPEGFVFACGQEFMTHGREMGPVDPGAAYSKGGRQ